MVRSKASVPDIVADAKIETEISKDFVKHIFHRSGLTAGERYVRREECWTRQQFLGQGAYGTVHLETCETKGGSKKLRAVKEVRKSVQASEELDYMRELEAIYKFSHPKVGTVNSSDGPCQKPSTLRMCQYSHCFVRSDGWFEVEDSLFITMEYLELGDLQRHLTKPLPELQARLITTQVLEGIRLMHDNGFVHRDLKLGVIHLSNRSVLIFVHGMGKGIMLTAILEHFGSRTRAKVVRENRRLRHQQATAG